MPPALPLLPVAPPAPPLVRVFEAMEPLAPLAPAKAVFAVEMPPPFPPLPPPAPSCDADGEVLTEVAVTGIKQYVKEVKEGSFPDDDHSYTVNEAEYEKFAKLVAKRRQI